MKPKSPASYVMSSYLDLKDACSDLTRGVSLSRMNSEEGKGYRLVPEA